MINAPESQQIRGQLIRNVDHSAFLGRETLMVSSTV